MKPNNQQLTGLVLSVSYRNTSMYGNCSYWVVIKDEYDNHLLCYTRPNSVLGYKIHSLKNKVVTFEVTYKKNDKIELRKQIEL